MSRGVTVGCCRRSLEVRGLDNQEEGDWSLLRDGHFHSILIK